MSQDMSKMMNDEKTKAFGARLKAAREAMHLETKDVASQLRLNERIILMLESGHYDKDLPLTFLKGYIRSYSKLLQLSDDEIKQATDPLQPFVHHTDPALLPPADGDITTKNVRMQFASALIALTVVGLVGTWWHNHATSGNAPLLTALPVAVAPTSIETPPSVVGNPVTAATIAPGSAITTAPSTSPDHPIANALAQQMAPAAPAAATPAPTPDKGIDIKPSAPAHKPAAAAKTNDDDDADDDDNDNNDNDQTD